MKAELLSRRFLTIRNLVRNFHLSFRSYKGKKILKALDSPVLQMSSHDLFEKLSSLPRWKGKFRDPIDGVIPIGTNKEIELMIDLLIERFTISAVTGQEYDTEVKRKADNIQTEA